MPHGVGVGSLACERTREQRLVAQLELPPHAVRVEAVEQEAWQRPEWLQLVLLPCARRRSARDAREHTARLGARGAAHRYRRAACKRSGSSWRAPPMRARSPWREAPRPRSWAAARSRALPALPPARRLPLLPAQCLPPARPRAPIPTVRPARPSCRWCLGHALLAAP